MEGEKDPLGILEVEQSVETDPLGILGEAEKKSPVSTVSQPPLENSGNPSNVSGTSVSPSVSSAPFDRINKNITAAIKGNEVSAMGFEVKPKEKEWTETFSGSTDTIPTAQDFGGVVDKGKEEKGSRLGYWFNGLLEGIGAGGAGEVDLLAQLAVNIPGFVSPSYTKEEAVKEIRESILPSIREGAKKKAGVEISSAKEEQYNNEFLTSAVKGVTSTAPQMGSLYGTGLFFQAYDSGLQSINNTEKGKDLPETTKTIFAGTVGAAQGALEKYGLSKIFGKGSTKVANELAAKTLNDLIKGGAKNITTETFEAALDQSAKALKTRVLKVGAATAIEAETGALQELSTILAEKGVNSATGENIFEPQSFGEYTGRVIYAAGQEAVGGGILGTASQVAPSSARNYISEKVSEAKSAEDIAALKQEIQGQFQAGKINEQQATEAVGLVDKYVAINSKIPAEVTNRKEVADLIAEKEEVQQAAEAKLAEAEKVDEAFKPAIEKEAELLQQRVEEINKEIVNPSEATPQVAAEVKSEITTDNGKGQEKEREDVLITEPENVAVKNEDARQEDTRETTPATAQSKTSEEQPTLDGKTETATDTETSGVLKETQTINNEQTETQANTPQAQSNNNKTIQEKIKADFGADVEFTKDGFEVKAENKVLKAQAEEAVEAMLKETKTEVSEQVEPESKLKFRTHTGEEVSGQKLSDALNKVADDMVQREKNIRKDDLYASHVTEKQKEDNLTNGIKYAEEVRQGGHSNNFTIWQRVNRELTGEDVPLFAPEKSESKPLEAKEETPTAVIKADKKVVKEKAKKKTPTDEEFFDEVFAKPSIAEIKSKVIQKVPEAQRGAKEEGVPLKVQKADLLGQIQKAIDTVVGNKKAFEETKQMRDEGRISPGLLSYAVGSVGEVVTKLKKAGFNASGESIVFDVEGDGTFRLAIDGLETAHKEVSKHWPTNEKHPPPAVEGTRQSLPKLQPSQATTLKQSKDNLQNAADNLEQAKKSGRKETIATLQKQFDLEREAYQGEVAQNKSRKQRIEEIEKIIKNGEVKSIYQANDIIKLENERKKVADFEGEKYNPSPVAWDIAENGLKELLVKAEADLIKAKEPHLKQDGTVKSSISVGAKRSIDSAAINIRRINDAIKELNEKKAETETIKEKSKKIANKIREGKLNKKGNLGVNTPASIAVDLAIETAATVVEKGGELAQAIADGIKQIRESEAYKNASERVKKAMEEMFSEAVENKAKEFEKENPPTESKEESEPEGEKKKHKLGLRVELSKDVDQKIQKGLLDKGIEYLSKAVSVSDKEAKAIIDAYEKQGDLDAAADFVLNPANPILGDVRVALEQQLYKKYAEKAANSTGEEAEGYRQKAVDILYAGMKTGMAAGRTVNMQKGWQEITGKDPEGLVQGAYMQVNEQNKPFLAKHEGVITNTVEALNELLKTEEGQKLLQEEVEKATDAEIRKYAEKNYGKEKLKKIDDALAKFQSKLRSRTYDATIGIPVAILDGSISVIRKAIYAGAKVSDAVQRGIDYIKEKHKGSFNEEQFRKDATDDLKEAGITDKDKSTAKTKDAAEKLKAKLAEIDTFIKNPEKALEALEEKKRKAAERVARNEAKSDEVKQLEKDIKLRRRIVSIIQGMDTLSDKQKKTILSDALDTIIQNGYLSETQFRNIVSKSLGLDHLTTQDEQRLREGANIISNVSKAQEAFLKDPSAANLNAYKKAVWDGRVANERVSRYFREKSGLFDKFATFIRGNLLSTKTPVLSFVSNVFTSPVRWLENGIASPIDFLRFQLSKIDMLSKNVKYFENKRFNDFLANQKGCYKGLPEGFIEGIRQLVTGSMPDEVFEREMKGGLHPLEAWQRLYAQASGKEKQSLTDSFNDLVEGTLGVAPEIVFRVLNLTDKPFRKSTHNAVLSELVESELNQERRDLEKKTTLTPEEAQRLSDIKDGSQYTRMMNVPDDAKADQAAEEALKAVFQNKNPLTAGIEAGAGKLVKTLTGIFSKKKEKSPPTFLDDFANGLMKLAATTQFPFINMPLNWVTEVFLLANPAVSGLIGLRHAKSGNVRRANQYFGKMFVGIMATQVALWLIKNGLVNGSGDDDDKEQRAATYALKKGYNRFNWSGYQRVLAGESGEWRKGDYSFEYYQLGLTGALIASMANMYEKYGDELEAQNKAANDIWDKSFTGATAQYYKGLSTARTGLNMPMVQGTNNLLNAISSGDGSKTDRVLVQTSNALKAIYIPATYIKVQSALNAEEVLKDVRDEDVWKWIKNSYNDQMGNGKDLPKRYTIWGEPIDKTPPDRNAWVYHLFDITKGAETPQDTFGVELYDLASRLRKENPELSKDVIPSFVPNNISIGGVSHKLTTAEYEELQHITGQKRKDLVTMYINGSLDPDYSFQTDSDEQKVKNLKAIYEAGYDVAKEQFAALKGWETEPEEDETEELETIEIDKDLIR